VMGNRLLLDERYADDAGRMSVVYINARVNLWNKIVWFYW